jgi:hypothetical protein
VVVKKQISGASLIEQKRTDARERCKRVSETKTGNTRKIGQHFGKDFSWLQRFSIPGEVPVLLSFQRPNIFLLQATSRSVFSLVGILETFVY